MVRRFLPVLVLSACVGHVGSGQPDGKPNADTDVVSDVDDVGPLNPLPPTQIPPPDASAVVIPNLDSAVINIEPVAGAKDYRAFVVTDGVEVLVDDAEHEQVNGATIFCAGQRQRAAPRPAVPEVIPAIEVTDLHGPTTYVVEAIDELCPFTGLFGRYDQTFPVTSPDVVNPDSPSYAPHLMTPVPIVTEATIRARYGSMIVNGQRPGLKPGQPAEPSVPKVLQRWTVEVSPLTSAEATARRTTTFFDDFSDNNDQPVWIEGGTNEDGTFHLPDHGYSAAVYQNSNFSFYATNAENVKGNHAFIDRGQLQIVLPDISQDTMGTVMAIPRKLAHFTDNGYLHVTFEGTTNSTVRRYWWLTLCGAEEPGETFDADDLLKNYIALTSGFFDKGGANPSLNNWNCLIVFPHDGIATPVPQDGSNPESSIIVLIHKANAPKFQTAVNVSPQQLNPGYPASWYRQQEAGEVTHTGILDDLLRFAPRVHFDFYISRNRLVMYVDGQQRLCNDFGSQTLTMAEAAVGFNDALYHSSAEHNEFVVPWSDHSGQMHYLENLIFADQHTWDNVGFEEGVALPDSFNNTDCHTYAP